MAKERRMSLPRYDSGLAIISMTLILGLFVLPRPAQGARTGTRRAKPAAARKATKSEATQVVNRRDPFRIPPVTNGGGGMIMNGPLPAGNRGLVISTLRLEGIVRKDNSDTMIAVVTNATRRAYFLRDDDEVYDGKVNKITPDSVTFTENYLDAMGQVRQREVALKLGAAPGEGR